MNDPASIAAGLREHATESGIALGSALFDVVRDSAPEELRDILRGLCVERAAFNITAQVLALNSGQYQAARALEAQL